MATLTIKNVPEPLVRRLKRRAAAHRWSLNLEVISCLETTVQAALKAFPSRALAPEVFTA